VHDHHRRAEADQRYRGERFHRIERRLVLEVRADRDDRLAEIQGVAVGIRLGRELHAEHAARARSAIDDDALPEQLAELVARDACDGVADAAGKEAGDQPQRSGRVVFGAGHLCRGGSGDQRQYSRAELQIKQCHLHPAICLCFEDGLNMDFGVRQNDFQPVIPDARERK
jgi:hypothetical protein